MLSIYASTYTFCLSDIKGMIGPSIKKTIDENKYQEIEKELKLTPYIEKLMDCVNIFLLSENKISDEDLYDYSHDKYEIIKNELDKRILYKKKEFYQSLVSMLEWYHDYFLLRQSHDSAKYKKFFNTTCKFKELQKEDLLFELSFLSAFLNPILTFKFISYVVGNIKAPCFDLDLRIRLNKNSSNGFDIEKIATLFSNLNESASKREGLKAENIFGDIYLKVDPISDIVIIPKFIDHKKVVSITSVAEENKKVKTVIILSDDCKIDNFLSNCPNIEDVYIVGDIQSIDEKTFANSKNLIVNEPEGKYLKANNNEHFIFINANKSLKHIQIKDDCRIIASNAFLSSKAEYVSLNKVKFLSKRAFAGSKIKEISLINIAELGEHCFYNCASLARVELGENITFLRSNVFDSCVSLKKIYLPKITYLGSEVFLSCTSLREIIFGMQDISTSYGVFKNCHPDLIIYGNQDFYELNYEWNRRFSNVKHTFKLIDKDILDELNTSSQALIDEYEFLIWESSAQKYNYIASSEIDFSRVIIPASHNDVNIKKVTDFIRKSEKLDTLIFKGDIELLQSCLEHTPNLEKVLVNGDLKYVCSEAFEDSLKLKTVYEGVTYIKVNDNPYYICSKIQDENLKHVKLHDSCVVVQQYAFADSNIESIDLNNVKYLSDLVFYQCKNLKKIIMNDTLKEILGEEYLIDICPQLEEIVFSKNLWNIEGKFINDCIKIKKLIFPPKLEKVDSFFIGFCDNLTEIYFPESVKEFSFYVVNDCHKLKTIKVSSKSFINQKAFVENKIELY